MATPAAILEIIAAANTSAAAERLTELDRKLKGTAPEPTRCRCLKGIVGHGR